MKLIRTLLLRRAAPARRSRAAAAEDEAPAFGHVLTLVQVFVRIAAQSDDPIAGLKAIDDVLAGRNTEANQAAAGLFKEMTADMPAEHRAKVASIGRRRRSALARTRSAAKAPRQARGLHRQRRCRRGRTSPRWG